MNLVAECDIPFTSLVKPAWQELLQVLCPSIQIPCVAILKSILLKYYKFALHKGLQDFKENYIKKKKKKFVFNLNER